MAILKPKWEINVNKLNILLWPVAVLLVLNSVAMWSYATAIRSTYAFIAGNTVFYPLAYLNFFTGTALLFGLIWKTWAGRKNR